MGKPAAMSFRPPYVSLSSVPGRVKPRRRRSRPEPLPVLDMAPVLEPSSRSESFFAARGERMREQARGALEVPSHVPGAPS